MIKQTQKFLLELLRKELITVLAIAVVGMGIIWTQAASDTVLFSLTVDPAGEEEGGGGGSVRGDYVWVGRPNITNVNPAVIFNDVPTVLDVTGSDFDDEIVFRLGEIELENIEWVSANHVRVTVPANVAAGDYRLWAYNSSTSSNYWVMGFIQVLGPQGEAPAEGDGSFYSAKWIRQSPYLTLKPGQEAEMWVEFQNTGTLPWYSAGANPVRLGTSNPLDRSSLSRHATWASNNRSTALDSAVVNPGEVGRFAFKVKAPNSLGSYREYFRPVVEFKEWLPDYGVYWDIQVVSNRGVIRATPPSTGGEPTAETPATSTQFSDSTEGLFQSLTSALSRLFSGIANLFSGWF